MLQLRKPLFVVFLFSVILFITKVYSLDPSTVDIATKRTWCDNQIHTCTNICLDSGSKPQVNYCTPENLAFDCVCDNGVRPNSTEYTQTIPYFTCTADQQACIKTCQPGDQACVDRCNKVPCAATHVKTPGTIQNTAGGGGNPANPAATGTATPTPKKPPTTLLDSNAVTISPIQGGFMLLLTFVVTLMARLNSL